MKHIYLFDENCNATQYGIGTYIASLIRILDGSGMSVTVVNMLTKNDMLVTEFKGAVRYIKIPELRNKNASRKLYYRNVFYLLHPYIRKEEENIAHINYRNCKDLLLLLKQYFDFKILLTWHYSSWVDWVSETQLVEMYKKQKQGMVLTSKELAILEVFNIERQLVEECCDKVIAIAQHSFLSMQSIYGIQSEKLKIVYNGLIDHTHSMLNISDLKLEFHLPIHEKIILFVGRLDENKNVLLLIKAFLKVRQNHESVRLIIVGSGNFVTPLSISVPFCSNITYTGFISKEELCKFYEIADIGVIPSKYEEFGYVAVEMMMHGLPIIANRTGGLLEIIEDGVSGILLDLKNDEDEHSINILSEAIIRLLSNDTEKKKYGLNARKRYLDYFGMKAYKDKMLDIYNEK